MTSVNLLTFCCVLSIVGWVLVKVHRAQTHKAAPPVPGCQYWEPSGWGGGVLDYNLEILSVQYRR